MEPEKLSGSPILPPPTRSWKEPARLMSHAFPAPTSTRDDRWLALAVLCTGMLMIVLDATIVNVALPAIQRDLGFDQSSLAWVVNAYLIAFGGVLLLAGRLGDLLGRRRIFLAGLDGLHGRLAAVRPERRPADPDPRPVRPGRRRGDDLGGHPRDDRHDVHGGPRADARDQPLQLRRLGRRVDRPARRRRPDGRAQLALDLLRQPADRHRDRDPRGSPARGRPGPRPRERAPTSSVRSS